MSKPFAATAPVSIAKVGLKARDADRLAQYYQDVVGLSEIGREDGKIVLGASGRGFFEIERAPGAKPDDPRSAGLFHTAFLLPDRADLARWTRHAAERRIRLEGASDHLVSEAIYLTDPEGNGIEIYADRAPERWPQKDGSIEMATLPLDVQGLIASSDGAWTGVPDDTIIGHVHLRVGDPAEAERWWNQEMGFQTMARYGSAAVFLATGGYHHHIGANSWQSAGAGPRDRERSGLSFVELFSKEAASAAEREDPWGTVIRTAPAP